MKRKHGWRSGSEEYLINHAKAKHDAQVVSLRCGIMLAYCHHRDCGFFSGSGHDVVGGGVGGGGIRRRRSMSAAAAFSSM
jgi:hypothetical protein